MKEHYTKTQAAAALGISRQAVHQAVKSGRIPISDSGIEVDLLENWRIARIKEAHEELVKRQNVPSLLGDVRKPVAQYYIETDTGALRRGVLKNEESGVILML